MSSLNFSRGPGRKGQMFLIGSIIVVVALVLIKTTINVNDVLEKKNFLESGQERLEFSNLRAEVPRAAYNAVNYSINMTNVTNGFIAYAENRMASRTASLDGVSVDSQYINLTQSVATNMNVTFYNFFDTNVSTAVLNLSTNFGAPVTFTDIGPGTSRSTQFSLNLGSSQNLTMWIYYRTPTDNVTQNVTIPADVNGKTKFIGYFDLRMKDSRGTLRDRFNQTIDVN